MKENEIGTQVVDCAVELHRNLGPGLLQRWRAEMRTWQGGLTPSMEDAKVKGKRGRFARRRQDPAESGRRP